MSLQARLLVGLVLILLFAEILRLFFKKSLGSGQTLFWCTVLFGGFVLGLFPALVDLLGRIWGNLLPVSWITFLGMTLLIAYILHQSVQVNRQRETIVRLAREFAYLEERLNGMERGEQEGEKEGKKEGEGRGSRAERGSERRRGG
ncbi:MAG: DUF2304 domain-containing protein, partial [Candidatus Hydrogenedentota bacterium]